MQFVKTLLLAILSPFKAIFYALCKKRFRKLFKSKSAEDLNSPTHQQVNHNQSTSNHHVVDFDQSWSNDWSLQEDPKNSNAAKIQEYRQQLQYSRQRSKTETQPEETVAEMDYFSEMEPQNVKQTRVLLQKQHQMSDEKARKSRLSVSNDETLPEINDPTLRNWGEDELEDNQGWDAEEEDINDVLKEHRRMRKANHF